MTRAPLPLDDLLRRIFAIGELTFISMTSTREGEAVQVSYLRKGTTGYRVEIDADPVRALERALGPDHSGSWEERLRLGESPPAAAPAADEDDLSDVL